MTFTGNTNNPPVSTNRATLTTRISDTPTEMVSLAAEDLHTAAQVLRDAAAQLQSIATAEAVSVTADHSLGRDQRTRALHLVQDLAAAARLNTIADQLAETADRATTSAAS